MEPYDKAYTAIGRTAGYQALALALGYGATSHGGSRFLQIHTGPTFNNEHGWKSTAWFRTSKIPKQLYYEAPPDVQRSFSLQY